MNTGYYGISGKSTRSKVHLDINGHPACGAKIHKDAEFQWCASGIKLDYLECKHCLKIATNIILERTIK